MGNIMQNSLSDQVYQLVKDQILSGKLKGGEKISEEALAAEFKVSRTPIREAIRRLNEYGLVEIKPRCYAEVCTIGTKEAEDVANVRIALENLAIDSITPALYGQYVPQIARYSAECQYALNTGNRAVAFEQDSLFHLELVKASGNIVLFNTYQRLDAKIQQLRINQNLPEEELSVFINQHAQIMQLLKEGKKAECKDLIYDHIMHKRRPSLNASASPMQGQS